MKDPCCGTSCKAKCAKIALLVVVGVAALGLVVMWLWNWLMPALFQGANSVTYWQALGLLVLSKILFGKMHGRCGRGCRKGGWGRKGCCCAGGCCTVEGKDLSPAEREQLLASKPGCCGSGSADKPAAPNPQ